MSNLCLPSVQACAMRVARLDPTGVPDPGADNLYVTSGLITLTATPVYRPGDEFQLVTACGDLCLDYRDQNRLRRYDVELNICAPDPELTELFAGGTVLDDGLGAIGYAAPELLTNPNPNGVSIELWSRAVDDDGVPHPTHPYYWWVLPRVWLSLGAKNFENGPMNNPFSGWAKQNSNWYDGPANDWPVASSRVIQYIPTSAATLPTAACGYQNTPVS